MRCLVLAVCGLFVGCDHLFNLVEVESSDVDAAIGVGPTADATHAGSADANVEQAIDGLIAWYRLDSLTNLTALEEVRGLNGKCPASACPNVVPGKRGNAFIFGNDIVDVPATFGLDTLASFTIAAWAKQISTAPTNPTCFVSKQYGSMYLNSWQLCAAGTSASVRFYSGNVEYINGGAFAINQWHHFAATWDGAVLSLVLDGEIVGTRLVNTVRFDGGAIRIGADRDSGLIYGAWPGLVDDVRIYNRALRLDEIAVLATP